MGRRKREKKKKKRRAGENTGAVPESAAGVPAGTGWPDFSHLSGQWRDFYRLVTDRLNSR